MDDLKDHLDNTLISHLGIEILEVSNRKVVGKMPVDHRTVQPAGILHGGASVAFAETLASIGGNASIDFSKQMAVGLEINANHIKSVRKGWVFGEATAVHVGRKTQVWEIRITNKDNQLVCLSRMTLAVLTKDHKK